jgi:hypothetical protein
MIYIVLLLLRGILTVQGNGIMLAIIIRWRRLLNLYAIRGLAIFINDTHAGSVHDFTMFKNNWKFMKNSWKRKAQT